MIDIRTVIDGSPMGRYQWRVISLCALGALLDGFDIQAMAFAVPYIADQWGVPRSNFGPALAASFGGLLLGAILFGSLGDRFGRRPVLIGGLFAMGVCSLLTALSDTMLSLVLLRAGTGLAIGACLPNLTALTAEIVPSRRLDRSVIIMFSAVPLGGVIGGYLAADVATLFGWHGLFVAGGLLPIALAILFWTCLPESPQHIARFDDASARVGKLLERIASNYTYRTEDRFTSAGNKQSGGMAMLFSDGRLALTLSIWAIFFLNLFVMYTLQSWLPSMLRDRAWPLEAALRSVALFQLAGICGGLIGGWFSERFSRVTVLFCFFLLSGLLIVTIGWIEASIAGVTALIAATGFVVIGGQQCMLALTAASYPTSVRATGIGWGLGVGRMGAVVGPLVAGAAMGAGYGQSILFTVAAVAPCLCCILLAMLPFPKIRSEGAMYRIST